MYKLHVTALEINTFLCVCVSYANQRILVFDYRQYTETEYCWSVDTGPHQTWQVTASLPWTWFSVSAA